MESEQRWRRLDELFHAALERKPSERARFLEEACGDDESLLNDVQSLLDAEERAGSFVRAPAIEAEAKRLAGERGPALVGRRLGNYRVLSLLGVGGMGEVYRARDVKLGREVAIKVVSTAFSLDRDRLTRFHREARALASLNHSGIATLYGYEESEGTDYLVMELVHGERLDDILERERLAPGRALDLVIEVAEALARAHDKRIIHRDLKPTNIMVTKDGHAKIIDFGVAKLLGPLEPTATDAVTSPREQTESHVLLGTAAYMSPEQARGEDVDHRTDIFAFGVVLLEMLSGTHPFRRPSATETLSAILSEPAPPLSARDGELPAGTLTELQRVLDRCLAKDREERYHATRDLEIDLRRIRRSLEGDPAIPSVRRPPLARGARAFALASLLAMALGALSVLLFRAEPVPRLSDPVQLTRSIGGEAYPAWSPDGGRLAFHLNTKGDEMSFDIWLVQIAGGDVVNLTADHPGSDRWPVWSPDGSRIAFWSERDGGGYFVVSALGGPARKLIARPPQADPFWGWWARPQFSPDGSELLGVINAGSASYAHVVSIGSGASRSWPLPGGTKSRYDPSWSSGGRYLAYLDGTAISDLTALRVLRIEDGHLFAVTDGRSLVSSPSWSPDGRFLYFVSKQGGSSDLWRQRMQDGVSEGAPERVTTGIRMTSAALSSDGRRLAYSTSRLVSNVWRVPILADRAATWNDGNQITFDEAFVDTLDVSPDGSQLAIDSDRSGNADVWILPSGGGAMHQLTAELTPETEAKWSPSGDTIAFSRPNDGTRIQAVSGGPARFLTRGYVNGWSPDGRSILFTAIGESGNDDIWVMPADGGEPRLLVGHPSDDRGAQWSPDGSWIAFWSMRSGKEAIWRLPAEGGDPEPLAEDGYGPCWSRDGKRVFYIGLAEKSGSLLSVSVEHKSERTVAVLSGRRGGPGGAQSALTCSDTYLYFTWQEDRGDIWVADVVRDR